MTFPRTQMNVFWLMLALGLSSSVQAESLKFAYVNTERIYSEAKISKAAQTRLEKEFSSQRQALESLIGQAEKVRKQVESMKVDDANRRQKERDWEQLDREIRAKERAFREDLIVRRNEEFAGVRDRANTVIRQLAKEEKFDLILQEAVYVHPRFDVTDKVLKMLDQ